MLSALLTSAAERLPLPDSLMRFVIDRLCGISARALQNAPSDATAVFAAAMQDDDAIASHTDAANRQHYEVPAAFFAEVLGPQRKYSCCLYPSGSETLAEAETLALDETMAHAQLADGQRILELGCGWGSLSLAMAQRFPNARITAVSNSASQRAYITGEASQRGLSNLQVITANMVDFAAVGLFDRVVSVEMFEHMSNWRQLFGRVRSWLGPDGRFFMHVFTHKQSPYRFRAAPDDWIGQHFFTGGIMPSHALATVFADIFALEQDWQWSGTHYALTARDWLHRFDANIAVIRPILRDVYGNDARLWERRWRMFFLATEGLFGHAGGSEWGVSHYLMRPAAAQ